MSEFPHIREAAPGDVSYIVEIEKAASIITYPHPSNGLTPKAVEGWPWEERVKRYCARLRSPEASLLVAEIGEVVVGFALTRLFDTREEGAAHLQKLYVAPQQQNRGVGGALLAKAEAWATDQNAVAVELDVTNYNYGARRFYERAGYTLDRDPGPKHIDSIATTMTMLEYRKELVPIQEESV